ncbi:MAG: DUF4321 domain-containing protein [Gemmatimonadetes bacterium]|jgi:hypothetical protein|nr:DUF4321 domain-containing protein [Gemmatimonadota bacterium]MBT4610048.1 DUF4321 domain-containing protein [Gemmatimonadota bacterium]MBT5055759.1 DUF4321 domain-containing protein [Gemmatimonadota bacterium]MBT5141758.1 DUF4321 domain-containing protein [Gemmatimonadota bacterium]MBT5591061.1 DUF4321 domain-containing protein [Gemmatimonadota bacterium]
MLRDKPIGHLIVILFISAIGGSVVGESLRLILRFVAGDGSIVERALLDFFRYEIGPHMLNLIILSFQFELALNFNVITLLGLFVGWYYFKYSY